MVAETVILIMMKDIYLKRVMMIKCESLMMMKKDFLKYLMIPTLFLSPAFPLAQVKSRGQGLG